MSNPNHNQPFNDHVLDHSYQSHQSYQYSSQNYGFGFENPCEQTNTNPNLAIHTSHHNQLYDNEQTSSQSHPFDSLPSIKKRNSQQEPLTYSIQTQEQEQTNTFIGETDNPFLHETPEKYKRFFQPTQYKRRTYHPSNNQMRKTSNPGATFGFPEQQPNQMRDIQGEYNSDDFVAKFVSPSKDEKQTAHELFLSTFETKTSNKHNTQPSHKPIKEIKRFVRKPTSNTYVPQHVYCPDDIEFRTLIDYSQHNQLQYPYPISHAPMGDNSPGESFIWVQTLAIQNDINTNKLCVHLEFGDYPFTHTTLPYKALNKTTIEFFIDKYCTAGELMDSIGIRDSNACFSIEDTATIFVRDDVLSKSRYAMNCITHNRYPKFRVSNYIKQLAPKCPPPHIEPLITFSEETFPVTTDVYDKFTLYLTSLYLLKPQSVVVDISIQLICGSNNLTKVISLGKYYDSSPSSPPTLYDSEYKNKISINDKIDTPLTISSLPLDAQLRIVVKLGNHHLGTAIVNVYDAWGILKTGPSLIHLQNNTEPIGSYVTVGPILEIDFGSIRAAYHIPSVDDSKLMTTQKPLDSPVHATNFNLFEEAVKADKETQQSPVTLTSTEKQVIMDGADLISQLRSPVYITQTPPPFLLKSLMRRMTDMPPEFLLHVANAVHWDNITEVDAFVQYLWTLPLRPLDALLLLSSRCPYRAVRAYCTHILSQQSDDVLMLYSIHLSEALRHEEGLSPLTDFLIRRAVQNPAVVGYSLFSDVRGDTDPYDRHIQHARFLEAFLVGAGPFARECAKACEFSENIRNVNSSLIRMGSQRDKMKETLLNSIGNVVPVPFCPGVSGLINTKKSKIFTSNAAPILLDIGSRKTIFKLGDDLRQDALVLRSFELFEELWRREGLDYRMTPFKVLPIGTLAGFLEFVEDSRSVGSVHLDAIIPDVFNKKSIMKWLEQNHKAPLDQCIDNFYRSCVGYCVASYVLGLADRHNDNLMVDKSGHFLHIDFAHFLGNKLKIAGVVNREPAPFVLTDSMLYVFCGDSSSAGYYEKYAEFCAECVNAYRVLRANARLIVTFFTNMISSKLSQLSELGDAEYLHDSLQLGTNDEVASNRFVELIHRSLNTEGTNINFMIHSLVQKTKK
ncbi:Phosphatidylinositol kinase [Entamoeba marina]